MAAAAQPPTVERRARVGRLRRVAPTAVQIVAAISACTLWAGVASPGLKLLPGLDGLSDESISISLQSAVLGIDDGSNRPAEERARAAASVLGLAYGESLLSPAAVRAGVAARADGGVIPGVVSLGEIVAAELAAASAPVGYGETDEPDVDAQVAPSAAAPAEAPPAPGPAPPVPRASAPPTAPAAAPPAASALAAQTIEFARDTPLHAVVGGKHVVVARASSGLPLRFSIAGRKDVCKLSGATLTFREGGLCVVEAHQPGSARYKEARAQHAIAVGRAGQSIVFSSTPPARSVAGGPAYTAAAAAGSRPAGLVLHSGREHRRLLGLRLDRLLRRAPARARSRPTRPATTPSSPRRGCGSRSRCSRRLVPRSQSITFTSTAPAAAIVGGATYSVAATASSGLAVDFAAAASAGVCTVTGSRHVHR